MAGTYIVSFSNGITFALSREEVERLADDGKPGAPYALTNLVTLRQVRIGPGKPLTHEDVRRISNEDSH